MDLEHLRDLIGRGTLVKQPSGECRLVGICRVPSRLEREDPFQVPDSEQATRPGEDRPA